MNKNELKTIKMKYTSDTKVYVQFLTQTRNGKYAPIEESSLPYSRTREVAEGVKVGDCYSYSLS